MVSLNDSLQSCQADLNSRYWNCTKNEIEMVLKIVLKCSDSMKGQLGMDSLIKFRSYDTIKTC